MIFFFLQIMFCDWSLFNLPYWEQGLSIGFSLIGLVCVLEILGNLAWTASPPDCLLWEDEVCYLESFQSADLCEGSEGTTQVLISETCPRFCVFLHTVGAFSGLSPCLYCWSGEYQTQVPHSKGKNIPPQRNISRPTKELCPEMVCKAFSPTRKLWN